MKLKKGDNVKILSGKDRGRTGVVLKAYPDDDRIQIDGLNVFKKRSKPRKQGEKGQVVAVSRPLAASKVMIICPNCKSPTRMGGRREGTRKVRYCKKCKATLS
jgi:large subunit ribosomal protein L24